MEEKLSSSKKNKTPFTTYFRLFVLLFFSSLFLFLLGNSAQGVQSMLDQSSYVMPSYPAYQTTNQRILCQSFIPNVDVTTSISLYLKENTVGKGLMLSVYTMPGRLDNFSQKNATGSFKWENFPLAEPGGMIAKALQKGTQYKVCLNAEVVTTSWAYAQPGGYSRGTAIKSGVVLANTDFGFMTYGYNNDGQNPAGDKNPGANPAGNNQGASNSTANSNNGSSTTRYGPEGTSSIKTNTATKTAVSLDKSKSSFQKNLRYIVGLGLIDLILTGYLIYRIYSRLRREKKAQTKSL